MEWISVKDRLPERKKNVLAYGIHSTMAETYRVCCAQYNGLYWYMTDAQQAFDHVYFWMPLPELP